MILLSLATAGFGLGSMNGLVSGFSQTAHETDQETAILGRLVPAMLAQQAAAHGAIYSGAGPAAAFLVLDAEVASELARADAAFDEGHQQELLKDIRARWDEMYEPLRPIAADPVQIANLEALLGDDDAVHLFFAERAVGVDVLLADLNASAHSEARRGLADAERARQRLLVGMAGLFAVSVGVTLRFSRHMRRDVLEPLDGLAEVARRFGEGDYGCRASLDRDDELGVLGQRFDAMAASLTNNHRSLTLQAYHDALTGLANRPAFVRHLTETSTVGGPQGVLFIDLDDFKTVNDTLGHAAGDELLRQVAERLERATRPTDLLSRLGGDEFAVVLGAPATIEGASRVAERMLEELLQPFPLLGRSVRIGASIGVALGRLDEEGADSLLRRADVAMYAAKGRGKNRFEVFDPVVHGPLLDAGDVGTAFTAVT